jgi:hypothetical protein
VCSQVLVTIILAVDVMGIARLTHADLTTHHGSITELKTAKSRSCPICRRALPSSRMPSHLRVDHSAEERRQLAKKDMRKPSMHMTPIPANAQPKKKLGGPDLIACDRCSTLIIPARLAAHMKHAHGRQVTSAGYIRVVTPSTKRTCGDCRRTMSAKEFAIHVCRARGRSVRTISGGAPGGGKKR